MDNKLYKSSFGPGVHDDDSFKSQRMPIGSWGTDVPDHTAPVESEPTTTSDQECKTKKEKLKLDLDDAKAQLQELEEKAKDSFGALDAEIERLRKKK